MKNKLKTIIEQMAHIQGVDVSMYDDSFLVKSLEKRVLVTGSNSFSDYCDNLPYNKDEVEAFLNSLNINFSEFFRNPLTFAHLEQIVLPSLLEKKRKANENEIRIWSAAGASGQEAYSIAILCDEMLASSKSNMACRIFVTDINEQEMYRAQQGVFQTSYLNKVTLQRLESCFNRNADTYTIASRIKEYINFSVFDLLSEQGCCPPASVYGDFDLVFCSNLLFYYKPEYRIRILEKVENSLSLGGYLITSETEREIVRSSNYHEVFAHSAIFQKY